MEDAEAKLRTCPNSDINELRTQLDRLLELPYTLDLLEQCGRLEKVTGSKRVPLSNKGKV